MKPFERHEKDSTSGTRARLVRKPSTSISHVSERQEKLQQKKKGKDLKTLRARRSALTRSSNLTAPANGRDNRRGTTSEDNSRRDERNGLLVGGSGPFIPAIPPLPSSPPVCESSIPIKTREERKMEAKIKAFERLEKDEQRKKLKSGIGLRQVRKPSCPCSHVREKPEKLEPKEKSNRENRLNTLRPRRNVLTKSSNSIVSAKGQGRKRRTISDNAGRVECNGISVGISSHIIPGILPLNSTPLFHESLIPGIRLITTKFPEILGRRITTSGKTEYLLQWREERP